MNTNVNLDAALGAVGFVAGGAVLLIICLVAAHAVFTRRGVRLRRALVAAAGWVMLYLCLLLVFSFTSREKALARGEEKHFCEIDCHLAYSVTDVRRTKSVGAPDNQVTASGIFYVVTVRTRFDEQTISPRRGDAPLTPNSRVVTVLDARGQSYSPSPDAMRAISQASSADTPISTPLRPGEYYTTTFVFDLPEAVENPALLISEGELVTHFVIGHENSPLHKKVLFRLDEAPKQVASNKLSRTLASHMKGVVSAVLRRIKGYDTH
jgi:energy-coupling factor transporter transmembrane protein EcfT